MAGFGARGGAGLILVEAGAIDVKIHVSATDNRIHVTFARFVHDA